jgi:hypothetical protein
MFMLIPPITHKDLEHIGYWWYQHKDLEHIGYWWYQHKAPITNVF